MATVLLLVTMLNMLVAIMGETFVINNEREQENRFYEYLQFVIDNWYALKPEDETAYLVVAWVQEVDEDDIEILKEVRESLDETQDKCHGDLKKLQHELNKISMFLSSQVKK